VCHPNSLPLVLFWHHATPASSVSETLANSTILSADSQPPFGLEIDGPQALCVAFAAEIYLRNGRPDDNYSFMIDRPYWRALLKNGWKKRRVVWLAGVRRVGKTTLAHKLPHTMYMNCDLPSVVRRLEDPELFYESQAKGATIVFDEVHRLPDPSMVLKIAADTFSHLQVLATGSSTLAATRKFRDSLTGRKSVVILPPVLWPECEEAFGIHDLDLRMLHGGLPEQLLARKKDDAFFAEWMDSFCARDIQELFGIRNRTGFLNLFRLLLRQSGGLLDHSSLSRECDLSRPTVKAHLEALTIACAVNLVRPFHGGGRREIVRRPRAYGFDAVNPKSKSLHLAWGFPGYLSPGASERQMLLDTCRRSGIMGLPLRYLGFSEK
jgi:predicted AAA+ superfamily ATPase